MSDISADEKRKLLRERRQAKMAQGNASQRLNTILTQGSSVNTATVSVLDKKPVADDDHLHADPEVPDITTLLHNESNASLETPDMDEMLLKIFSSVPQGPGGEEGSGDANSQLFAQMMKMMTDDSELPSDGVPQPSQDATYLTKLAAYHAYEQRRWKVRFLVVRFLVHTANFIYHYVNYGLNFQASLNVVVRASVWGVRSFFVAFVSCEIAVISSYFMVLSSNGLLRAFSKNHAISKLIGMASMVVPSVSRFQPLVDTLLVYWSGVSILVGDVSLLVVLFGLSSLL